MFSNVLIACFCMAVMMCFLNGTVIANSEVNHNVQLVKRFPEVTQKVCCVPKVVSFQALQNQITTDSNNVMKITKNRISYNANFVLGKRRLDSSYDISGQMSNLTRWSFKVNDQTTVAYESTDGQNCKCYKSNDINEWEPTCIAELPTSNVTKGMIGYYDATMIGLSVPGYNSQTWIFREPHMSPDMCWILSTTEVYPQMVYETQFYNMVDQVDNNLFKIPAKCPPIEQCLKIAQ